MSNSNVNKLNFVIENPSSATTTLYLSAAADGVLSIGVSGTASKVPVCNIATSVIRGTYKKQIAVAQVLQVQTMTFVGTANSVNYQWRVIQMNPLNGQFYDKVYSITTPATGTVSATTIGLQAQAVMRADLQLQASVGVVAGAVTLTALTGYAVFTLRAIVLGGGLTVAAASTAGVYPYGMTPYNDLYKQGCVSPLATDNPGSFTGSTAGYTSYTFTFTSDSAQVNTQNQFPEKDLWIWINNDGANAAALITAADTLFAAL